MMLTSARVRHGGGLCTCVALSRDGSCWPRPLCLKLHLTGSLQGKQHFVAKVWGEC